MLRDLSLTTLFSRLIGVNLVIDVLNNGLAYPCIHRKKLHMQNMQPTLLVFFNGIYFGKKPIYREGYALRISRKTSKIPSVANEFRASE